jgi:hypothetical protein
MTPTDFEQANTDFGPPPDMTEEQCSHLQVCRAYDTNGFPVLISCWKVSWKERIKLLFGRPLWLTIIGGEQPPVSLNLDYPFKGE